MKVPVLSDGVLLEVGHAGSSEGVRAITYHRSPEIPQDWMIDV